MGRKGMGPRGEVMGRLNQNLKGESGNWCVKCVGSGCMEPGGGRVKMDDAGL